MGKSRDDGDYDKRSPAETERIREATLRRLLTTPPKPHADMVKERREATRQKKPKEHGE